MAENRTAATQTGNEAATQVFISYSRTDSEAAEQLRLRLMGEGFEAYLDKHDIAAGEEWRGRLGGLIESADTVLFLVSPDSVASRMCDWEVNHAELTGKRVIPVVCRDTPGTDVPERLRRLNYVFMRDDAEATTELPKLTDALRVDIGWIRAQTRYGELAEDWERASRPSRLLLRGASIGEAEHWRDSRPSTAPQLTVAQTAFIAASRRGATLRQRGWLGGALVVAAMAIGLSVFALLQQQAAEASRRETSTVLGTSDFRQGSGLVDDAATAPDGIAFLARAARGGDSRAETRLWTLWQQRSFWVPLPDETAPPVEPPVAIPAEIASRFATADYNGKQLPTHDLAVSANNNVVFVAIGGVVDPDVQDVLVRVFRADGAPLTDWFQPLYTGELYLWGVRGVLSAQGRYLAIEAQGWREAAYVLVFDLAGPLTPLAADIRATGPLPAIEGATFTYLSFEHRPGMTDADEPPRLLAGSSRGDAVVYVPGTLSYSPAASASHHAAVTQMAIDSDDGWVMSVSTDRFVTVTDLATGGAIGSPMRVSEPVVRIGRTASNEISIDQEGATRTRFAFQPPIARHYTGTVSEAPGLGATQEVCYRTGGLNRSEGPVAHPSGLTLSVERGRNVVVVHPDGTRSESPRFLAGIGTLCASDDGTLVSVTTEDYRTEIWTSDFASRLGPAMDESRYLGAAWPAPEVTDWVQLSPDGRTALIRSSFWESPNIDHFWLTAWDTATGLPLSEHQYFRDEGDGPVTSATLDPKLGKIAYLANGQPTGATLELTPPPAVAAGLADYMEGVVGELVDRTGLSQPLAVANRLERLNAGNAALAAPQGSP